MAVVVGVAIWLASTAAGIVQAREGFYLGAGLASQNVTGDLDGEAVFLDAAGTKAALVGEIGQGSGLAWRIGYGFGENFALEATGATSAHTAEHDAYNDSSEANLSAVLLGARLNLPFSDSLEVFGRIGVGGYSVTYDTYGLTGITAGGVFYVLSETDVTFAGSGTGIGVGAELMLGQVGIELGVTQHQAQLDRISGLGVENDEIESLSLSITAIDVIVSYYFQ